MTHKDYLEKVVDYIELQVHETLTLDILADYVGFSKYYLDRLFSIYTGLSIMAYVRKRKLNHAMADLKTNARIIDIAYDYNYASDRAFSRAFIKEFGKSPGYFRSHKPQLTSQITLYELTLTKYVEKDGIQIMVDYINDVKLVTLKEMTVLSGTIISLNPEEEIIDLMTRLAKDTNISPQRTFGFDVPIDDVAQGQDLRGYEYWLVLNDNDLDVLHNYNSNGTFIYDHVQVCKKSIPTYRYASLRITDPFENPFERIPLGWKTLVQWLENSNTTCKPDNNSEAQYCLEEIIEVKGVTCMDIFIPIDKA